jgi:hypothetical protein
LAQQQWLIALSISLLGTLVVSTWRFSSLATRLLSAVQRLEEKEKEQDTKLSRLDNIPVLITELEHVKKNYSIIPRLEGDIRVLKEQAKFSKEMRQVRLGSRPDIDDSNDS